TEPYNVARLFASIDHISRGRAAWNVVTSSRPKAALQQRVRCEPISPAGGAEWRAAFSINELLTTVVQDLTSFIPRGLGCSKRRHPRCTPISPNRANRAGHVLVH